MKHQILKNILGMVVDQLDPGIFVAIAIRHRITFASKNPTGTVVSIATEYGFAH